MATLTYGREVPESGQSGNQFCPQIERNIEKDDAHTHNGVNSPKLDSATAFTKQTGQALSSAWGGTLGNSTYRQEITLPSGYLYASTQIECRISGEKVDLRLLTGSATNKFYVYINDNSKVVDFIYL